MHYTSYDHQFSPDSQEYKNNHKVITGADKYRQVQASTAHLHKILNKF